MPKQRAPISTRLRNKGKHSTKVAPIQEPAREGIKKEEIISNNTRTIEDNFIFSPRVDTDIYLDELQSPLSFVRGTDEERMQYVKDEDDLMIQSFGTDYKTSLNTSSFYYAQLSAPVPSKRTRHLHHTLAKLAKNKRPAFMQESIKNTQVPFPMTNKRSISPIKSTSSSISPPPTPTPAFNTSTKNVPTGNPKGKKTTSSMNDRTCLINHTTKASSSPTKSIPSRATKSKSSKPPKKSPTYSEISSSDKDSVESVPTVPLPMSRKLPVYIKMDAKDKEREYWRRQRRVFVHSRFLTNDEGVQVAKSVYSNLSIGPTNRMVISMQGNIANFRTKLRRIFISQTKKFNISKEYIGDTKEDQLIKELTLKMNDNTLKYVWDHWITDPFVDSKKFYLDKSAVNLLRDITVKTMIIHFKEQFNFLSPRQARTEMRRLDLISRTIDLPDPTEY